MKSNFLSRLNGNHVLILSKIIYLLKNTKFRFENFVFRNIHRDQVSEFSDLLTKSNYFEVNEKSKDIILTELTSNIGMQFRVSYLANIIADIHGASLLYCSFNSSSALKWLRDSFNNDFKDVNVLSLDDHLVKQSKKDASETFSTLSEPSDILKISYRGLYIGDIVYDQIMRFGNWQASVWEINEKVKYVLERAYMDILFYSQIKEQYNVISTVGSHNVGYLSLLQRYFAYHGINGYLAHNAIIKYSSFKGRRLQYIVNFRRKTIDSIENSFKYRNFVLQSADDFLKSKFEGQLTSDIDSPRAFNKLKKIYGSQSEFCAAFNLSEKPCIFIMLHAFNDYPHHFDDGLYRDYFIWFQETLEHIKNNNNVNWIIKEHPTSELYPMDINLENMVSAEQYEHILFLDASSSFNSASLKNFAKCIITAFGTAGLENACFGIPCIITGPNHYYNKDIAIEPKSIKEYTDLLCKIHHENTIPTLSSRQIARAKILYYLSYCYIYGQCDQVTQFIVKTTKSCMLGYKNEMMKIIENTRILNDQNFNKELSVFIEDEDNDTFYVDPNMRNIVRNN